MKSKIHEYQKNRCKLISKKIFLFIGILISANALSQEDAWVYFNAKPNSETFLSNPLTMLTQRSLDRRTAQNIALDFKDVPVHQPYIDAVESAVGITVYAKSKWFNAVHVRGTQAQVNELSELSFVDHVDFANNAFDIAGRPARKKRIVEVNKTLETEVTFDYGGSSNQIEMLNGHLLHQQDYTGSGKIIAVMDGGFPGVDTAAPFARLRDNNLILGGYDFVSRNANFYTGITHGTLVLSTMGGFSDGELVGTAPDAAYYLFITEDGQNEGPLEESLWVEAAEEADRLGVDVINTSLGYAEYDNPNYSYTYEDMDGATAYISKGLDIAFSRGMVCVVSAGNQGNADWHYITAPADATNALTIGAVNFAGNHASFSSYGPSFDGRVKPDVVAQGQNSVISNASGSITTGSGTSFSGPIMAGMVASFWQALPDKTNAEIVQLIKESASIYANPNDELGYGIPDFGNALTSGLGVSGFAAATTFAFYPNPVRSSVSVAFPSGFDYSNVTLYNVLGQKVLQQDLSLNQNTISLNDLNSGVYFYKVSATGFSQSGKLIKR